MQRQFSAGGAVYKRVKEQESERVKVVWLIMKPTGREEWRVPKGHIEEGEEVFETAQREVLEETGVSTMVIGEIDTISWVFVRDNKKINKTTSYFLMEAVEETGEHDGETEKILWLPFERALKKLTYQGEKDILIKAESLLPKNLLVVRF